MENVMSSRYYQAAAAGAALIAAVTLAACGTAASPGTPASSTPGTPAPAAATTAAFNTADITFTTSTLGLEEQAAALAGTVTGHTATPELQQFAAGMQAQAGDAQRLRDLMGDWRRPQPAGPRAGPHHAGATPIRTRSAATMAARRAADGHDGLITTAARRRWQKRKSGENPVDPRLGMARA